MHSVCRPGAVVSWILKGWSMLTSTTPSRVALALRTECQERLFGRRSPSTRRWSCCWKKVRFDPKILQTSSDLANPGVPMSWRHICECASQVLHGRPEHRPPARRALDGAAAGLNVIVIVGAQAEGIGWARARSLQQWTGELSADPPWGMRAAVAVLLPCSVCHLLRPWTMCVSAPLGNTPASKSRTW